MPEQNLAVCGLLLVIFTVDVKLPECFCDTMVYGLFLFTRMIIGHSLVFLNFSVGST